MSPCQTQRHVAKLCGLADDQPYSYLYRDSPLDTSCPPILSGSHSLRYSEYSPTSDHYSQVLIIRYDLRSCSPYLCRTVESRALRATPVARDPRRTLSCQLIMVLAVVDIKILLPACRELSLWNLGTQNLYDPDPELCGVLAGAGGALHGREGGGLGVLGAWRLQVSKSINSITNQQFQKHG